MLDGMIEWSKSEEIASYFPGWGAGYVRVCMCVSFEGIDERKVQRRGGRWLSRERERERGVETPARRRRMNGPAPGLMGYLITFWVVDFGGFFSFFFVCLIVA